MVIYLLIHIVFCVAAIFVNNPIFWSVCMILSTCICLYKIHKLERSINGIKEDVKKQKTAFIESGNAITATLKIAFDNIKTLTHGQDKMKKEVKDHEARMSQRIVVKQEQAPTRRMIPNRYMRGGVEKEKSN